MEQRNTSELPSMETFVSQAIHDTDAVLNGDALGTLPVAPLPVNISETYANGFQTKTTNTASQYNAFTGGIQSLHVPNGFGTFSSYTGMNQSGYPSMNCNQIDNTQYNSGNLHSNPFSIESLLTNLNGHAGTYEPYVLPNSPTADQEPMDWDTSYRTDNYYQSNYGYPHSGPQYRTRTYGMYHHNDTPYRQTTYPYQYGSSRTFNNVSSPIVQSQLNSSNGCSMSPVSAPENHHSCSSPQLQGQTNDASLASGLPNIGVFFNRNQVNKPTEEQSVPAANSSNNVPSPTATNNSDSVTLPNSRGPDPPNGLEYNKTKFSTVTKIQPETAALPKPNDTFVKQVEPKATEENTAKTISVPNIQNQTENTGANGFSIQFPSSMDLGPIFEPNNSIVSKEKPKKRVTWLSDKLAGNVIEEPGSTSKGKPSGKPKTKREPRGKVLWKNRGVLETLPNNLLNYKPCKVSLKTVDQKKTAAKRNESSFGETSQRKHRNASKKPCTLSCCKGDYYEDIEERKDLKRPPLRLKIYRCKPCKVVLQDIWPWLMEMKQAQDEEEFSEDSTTAMSTEDTEPTVDGSLTNQDDKLLFYICTKCDISFPSAEECANHLKNVHNKSYFKCSSCLKQFHTHERFQCHIRTVCPPLKSKIDDAQLCASPVRPPQTSPGVSKDSAASSSSSTRSLFETFQKQIQQDKKPPKSTPLPKWDFPGLTKRGLNNRSGSEKLHSLEAATKDLCQHDRNRVGESIVSPEHDGFTELVKDENKNETKVDSNLQVNDNTGHKYCPVHRNATKAVVKIKEENDLENDLGQKSMSNNCQDVNNGETENQFTDTDQNVKLKNNRLLTFNSAVDKLILSTAVKNEPTSGADDNGIKTEQSISKPETVTDNINGSNKIAIPMYICKKCNLQFQNVRDCSKHLKTVHNKASHFKCTSCKKRFLTEPEFLNHIESICLPKDSQSSVTDCH